MYRDKKKSWYLITQVERGTRCYVSWRVAAERDSATLQAVVNAAPAAQQYYSDALPAYDALVYYPGHHQSLPNNSQTYAVEADNAELRQYLACLARRSRCFFFPLRGGVTRCRQGLYLRLESAPVGAACPSAVSRARPRFRLPLTFATPTGCCQGHCML